MPLAFAREVLQRLPLSEAVLLLTQQATAADTLNDLFDRERGTAYQHQLSFATLVALVGDALLEFDGSGRQSFQRGRDHGELTVSIQAAYQKLARLPLAVSEAFLADSTQRLLQVLPAPVANATLPASLHALDIVVLDGKVVKRVPKRLRPLRGCPGGVVGGKALAALSLRHRLVLALATHLDGHTNEVTLVPALLTQVRCTPPTSCGWPMPSSAIRSNSRPSAHGPAIMRWCVPMAKAGWTSMPAVPPARVGIVAAVVMKNPGVGWAAPAIAAVATCAACRWNDRERKR